MTVTLYVYAYVVFIMIECIDYKKVIFDIRIYILNYISLSIERYDLAFLWASNVSVHL